MKHNHCTHLTAYVAGATPAAAGASRQLQETNMDDENLLTYDIAVSFAGEDRDYVEQIANAIRLKGMSVFYDKYEEADLWGKDLYVHLTKVYKDYSKYCLMFISESYARKQWTSHERKAAQARAFTESREYILPLRIDDTNVDGILDTTGYIDSRSKSIEEIVELIRDKITTYNSCNGIESVIVSVEDAFGKVGIKQPNGQEVKDAMITTNCPTCGEEQLLSEASISLMGDETVYECKNGCQIIAVVSRPGIEAWQGRGYRLNDYVVRNARDMVLNIGRGVLMPASPAALKTKKA